MTKQRFWKCAGAAALLISLLGGCSFGPVVDGTRFYVLDAGAYEPASAADANSGVVLGLERVQIARYLDAPGIAIREERNRMFYSQGNRWAESLEHGLARLLTETLRQEPAIAHVGPYPPQRRMLPDFEVHVSLLRAEGVVDDLEASARFHATWEVRAVERDEVLTSGQVREVLPWDGQDFSLLAASLSEGAAQLSREIAQAVAEIGQNRQTP